MVTGLDLLRPAPVGPGLRAEIAAEDRSLVVQVAYDPAEPEALRFQRFIKSIAHSFYCCWL